MYSTLILSFFLHFCVAHIHVHVYTDFAVFVLIFCYFFLSLSSPPPPPPPSQLGVTAEHTQDKLAQANEQLRVDVEKWKESKDNEVKQIFLNWTSNQILYHEKVSRAHS